MLSVRLTQHFDLLPKPPCFVLLFRMHITTVKLGEGKESQLNINFATEHKFTLHDGVTMALLISTYLILRENG